MARPSFLMIVLLAGALSLRGGGEADAQTPHAFASAGAARGLVRLLDGSGATAVATADPSAPDVFVAALYIPRGQLLVVSGRHPSQEAVRYRIAMQQYREVYLDLQASPAREGKFFVQDANADGILSAATGSGDVDVLYEDAVRQTLFNGDPRRQGMTPAEYDARLAAADATYARLLTLLTSELEKGGAEESASHSVVRSIR
jgi:hypothetical protein